VRWAGWEPTTSPAAALGRSITVGLEIHVIASLPRTVVGAGCRRPGDRLVANGGGDFVVSERFSADPACGLAYNSGLGGILGALSRV